MIVFSPKLYGVNTLKKIIDGFETIKKSLGFSIWRHVSLDRCLVDGFRGPAGPRNICPDCFPTRSAAAARHNCTAAWAPVYLMNLSA